MYNNYIELSSLVGLINFTHTALSVVTASIVTGRE